MAWKLFFLVGWLLTKAPAQPTRRKLMMATWEGPSTGEIYGLINIPIAKSFDWASKQSTRITVTHMTIKAIGLALKKTPFINSKIVFDKLVPHDTVDVGSMFLFILMIIYNLLSFSLSNSSIFSNKKALIAVEGGNQLANAKIEICDKKSCAEISVELNKAAGKLRQGGDEEFNKTLATMRMLPTWVLRPIVQFSGWLAASLGLSIPALGVRPHPFGSCIVTSIGMLGLDHVYVPHTPFARVPVLVMVGQSKLRPSIDADGQVIAQEQLCLTATFDHRFIDGSQGGIFITAIKDAFENPALSFCRTDDYPIYPSSSSK
ncbi:MAG: 2-oxo acid dehydrogenase subunit E2 [archaeon]|nr:2-oxo acid dehydrogenase subunit E2 [archaeon]